MRTNDHVAQKKCSQKLALIEISAQLKLLIRYT